MVWNSERKRSGVFRAQSRRHRGLVRKTSSLSSERMGWRDESLWLPTLFPKHTGEPATPRIQEGMGLDRQFDICFYLKNFYFGF